MADAQLEFPVMGTTAHVIVVADTADAADAGVDFARARLEQLERRWSRFRLDSEITRCNTAQGAPVVVHVAAADLEAAAGRPSLRRLVRSVLGSCEDRKSVV